MSIFSRQPGLHGTRKGYQHGCRLHCCRQAEASYRTNLRIRKARGKTIFGARIPAGRTWQLLRQMKPEYRTYAEIARCLGLKKPELQLDTRFVTVRTALRVLRLYRLTMVENLDGPEVDAQTLHAPQAPPPHALAPKGHAEPETGTLRGRIPD